MVEALLLGFYVFVTKRLCHDTHWKKLHQQDYFLPGDEKMTVITKRNRFAEKWVYPFINYMCGHPQPGRPVRVEDVTHVEVFVVIVL